MSNNTAAAGVAGIQACTTPTDRYFLSLNGDLRGPFTRSQLDQQPPPSPGTWVWQAGQADWAVRPGSVATAKATVVKTMVATTTIERPKPPVPKPLVPRPPMPTPAATSQAKRSVADLEGEVTGIRIVIGQAIVDRSLPLANCDSAAERAEAERLLEQIAAMDEAAIQDQHRLDRSDPKSPEAARLRQSDAERRGVREKYVAALRGKHSRLGRAADEEPAVAEVLPDLYRRLVDALKALSTAKAEQSARAVTTTPGESSLHDVAKGLGGAFATGVLVVLKLVIFRGLPWYAFTGHEPADAKIPVLRAPVAAPMPAAPPVAGAGLGRADLALASAYVEVRWQTATGASGGCSGSASPALLQEDRLVLLTNRHLLDLDNLAAAKTDRGLQISQYQIGIKFPSGRVCPVVRFRPEEAGHDLMALDVDCRGLRPGVDFVVLPVIPEAAPLQAGDEVVAIGNPGVGDVTLENTQTFGHVSALRDDTDVNKVMTKHVQTDAAINHGNSGGPLLVKTADRYWWAGINTLTVARDQGYQGLNFAIDARQAVGLKFMEFDPTPAGMAKYLTSALNFPASAVTP